MSVTIASFKVRFPEFANTDPALVQAVIDEAAAETPARTWRHKADQGVLQLAAHKLAISPSGQDARLSTDGRSTYLQERERLERQIAYRGPRVT